MRDALIGQLKTIDGLLANISKVIDPGAILEQPVVWTDQGAADNDMAMLKAYLSVLVGTRAHIARQLSLN